MIYQCKRCKIAVETKFGSGKFCSRACANARDHSDATKEKMKKSGKISHPRIAFVTVICNQCQKSILVYPSKSHNKRNFCSKECRETYFKVNDYLTPEGKQTVRMTAVKNKKLGGNKNTRAYGWYESKSAGRVWLESSYEYKVALSLDAAGVDWIRPKFLRYDDKRYFPDFYLLEYDTYLDPKNDYLIQKDKQKLDKVREQNAIKLLVLNKTQLDWEIIQTLL